MFLLPFIFLFSAAGGNANPLYSVVPTTTGISSSNIVSTIPSGLLGQQVITTTPTVQSPYIQILRQPGLSGLGGSGSLGLTQLLNGQNVFLNNAGGVVPLGTSLSSTNGLHGLSSGHHGLSLVNINGVPVLVQSELGLQNGLQTGITATTLPQLGGTSVYQQPIIATQPTIGVNPVVRDVGVEVVEETPASLVQMDPMDAALLDMENQGQIHMEKYAWGRSNLNKPKTSTENTGELRSDFPRTYAQLPVGGIVPSQQPLDIINQNRVADVVSPTPSRTRNPFVDANGKRKKHFEFYQYFRNLNVNPPQGMMVPVAVFPSTTDDDNK